MSIETKVAILLGLWLAASVYGFVLVNRTWSKRLLRESEKYSRLHGVKSVLEDWLLWYLRKSIEPKPKPKEATPEKISVLDGCILMLGDNLHHFVRWAAENKVPCGFDNATSYGKVVFLVHLPADGSMEKALQEALQYGYDWKSIEKK